MAYTSGQVLTNTYSKSKFYVNWQQVEQSISGNYTRINWQAGLNTGSSSSHDVFYSNAVKIYNVYINGSLVSSGGTWSNITSGGDHQLLSGTVDIPHNGDGNKTFDISISAWLYSNHNLSGSGSFDLNNIPRYANITSFSVSKYDETTVRYNYNVDSNCDYAWYSTNNGASWSPLSNNNLVSGLSPNTIYNFKLRVRRTDSQLTTDSDPYAQSTYAYPYCTSAPDFTIGNSVNVGLYNPLNRNVTVTLISSNNVDIKSATTYSSSVNISNDNNMKAALYSSIPNSQRGRYKIKVTYGSINNEVNGGYYNINKNECTPIINTATYQDVNQTTLDITNNNQKIIKGHSRAIYNCTFTLNNYATASSCKVIIGEGDHNMQISNSSAESNSILMYFMVDDVTIELTDSRGLTTTKVLNINMLEWSLPTAILNIQRHNNFYSDTDINVDSDYAYLEGNNTIDIKVRYKKESDVDYGNYYSLSDGVTSVFTLDNNYAWNIQILISDKLGDTTYNTVLSRGMPIAFFDNILSSVGINCFPKGHKTLEVNEYEVVTKGSIITITGTFRGDISSPWVYVSIPSEYGVTNDNTVVVSIMQKLGNNAAAGEYYSPRVRYSYGDYVYPYVKINSNSLFFYDYYAATDEIEYEFKIVLMKTS